MKFMRDVAKIIGSIPSSFLAIGGGLLIILIIAVTIFGDDNEGNDEENQNTAENDSEEEITVSEESGSSEDDNEDSDENSNNNNNTTEVSEDSENDSLSNTQQETVESTVRAFSRNFLNLDSEQPEASIEGSQTYMTDDLYEEQKDFSYYGNWDEYRVEHDEFEIDVDPEMTEGVYKVAVESEGQAYDDEDNETKTQHVVLLLDVVSQGNDYLIDNISYEQYE